MVRWRGIGARDAYGSARLRGKDGVVMAETTISWTDRTVNPIRARNRETGAEGHFCEKLSPGCAHCYSADMNITQRFLGTGLDFIPQNRDKVEVYFDPKRLAEITPRKKPTRYFWCDMTDLFGSWVSDDWINQCFRAMAASPQHTHQILTKRPERMLEYVSTRWDAKHSDPLWHPLANVWLGVSVEDQQRADERLPYLINTPAAVRFLSVEPLLGEVRLQRNWLVPGGISWVIAGGESGSSRRPCEIAWIESLRDQCREAGVEFWCKQDSALRPGLQGRIPLDVWQTKEFPK